MVKYGLKSLRALRTHSMFEHPHVSECIMSIRTCDEPLPSRDSYIKMTTDERAKTSTTQLSKTDIFCNMVLFTYFCRYSLTHVLRTLLYKSNDFVRVWFFICDRIQNVQIFSAIGKEKKNNFWSAQTFMTYSVRILKKNSRNIQGQKKIFKNL